MWSGTSPVPAHWQAISTGREALFRFFDRLREVTEGTFTIAEHDVLGSDEHVVALSTWSGVREGIPVSVEVVGVFHYRDGRQQERWNHPTDIAALDRLLGRASAALRMKDLHTEDRLPHHAIEFAWPGDDCWDIFRGSELVTYQCGSKKQALAAGRYTIKGKSAPVFDPFEITVTDGGTIVKKS